MKTQRPDTQVPAGRRRTARHAGRRTGFTLVEIMIVVLILGVLLNIAAPAFIHARDSGQARACVANLHNITLAKEQWAYQQNIPSTYGAEPLWSDLQNFVHPGTTPTCPTTGAQLKYGLVNQNPTCPSYPNGPAGSPQLAHALP